MDTAVIYIAIHVVLLFGFIAWQSRYYYLAGNRNITLVQFTYMIVLGSISFYFYATHDREGLMFILFCPPALVAYWLLFLIVAIAGNITHHTPKRILADLVTGIMPLAAGILSFIFLMSRMGKIGG